jgi:hypothetical protein
LRQSFEAEHRPTHDQKWAALEAEDASFVREAIVRAQELREEGLDAGDAYLRGLADQHHRQNRQAMIEDVSESLNVLPETTEPDIDGAQ